MVANPTLRPEPALAGHGRRDEARPGTALNADPEQAAALAREGRAVPAGIDVQDHHDVGGARSTATAPTRRWPNPHELDLPLTDGHAARTSAASCAPAAATTVTMAEAFTESCNVTFGEIGLELGRGRSSQTQAQAFGFCPTDPPDADHVHRTDDPVRDRRSRPGGSRSPRTSTRTTRCWRSRRSAWTTCSRTRCRWRSSAPRSRTAASMMRAAARDARSATRRAA